MDQQTLIAICGVGLVICVGLLFMGGESSGDGKRVRELAGKKTLGSNIKEKLKVEDTGARRKQIEETLGKIEERQNEKRKKAKSLEARLVQADWSTKPQTFLIISLGIAVVSAIIPFVLGLDILKCIGLGFVVGFGIPRFFLNAAINKRQAKFTSHFADAMDIIVRGVRTGLPLGDCLKIIAHESPAPLGTEFRRVVEGESLGIPIEVCLEQMYERMPISEVNFFATVLNIQKTTGGNLGESLANLSSVLRGRKILREKIKALSAEAKVSAIIIGSLPIVVMLLVTVASPDYMTGLYTTPTGQKNMMIGAVMMVMGTLMMRKMMNFKF
ncbi:secretion protein F [Litorimonas cladophorae]|uniref:Secretion protein F n=1 Tax=Litorimonas cladophorae TaxID=1220491 RepID=A0A918NG84_9PROT|nr:type II secretion system F family protein [Litorimonas cladophorae]GGX65177.1 secretion protein F [Litorimonas cladophorae]